MAVTVAHRLTIVLAAAFTAGAQIHTPFVIGHSMGTMGTVLSARGVPAHEPWTPASVSDDSLRWGWSIAGVQYYDAMDNFDNRSLLQGAIGGWYRFPYVTLKASFQQLNVLDAYYEQSGFLSIGTRAVPFVSLSIEGRGYRAGLLHAGADAQTLGQFGASVWFPRKYAALSLVFSHVTIKHARIDGLDCDPTVALGLHTVANPLGAQGVVAEVTFTDRPRATFRFGEEYWFHPMFGVCAGLQSDPFLFGAGATFVWSGLSSNVSVVNHPVLGWSKGFMVEYSR